MSQGDHRTMPAATGPHRPSARRHRLAGGALVALGVLVGASASAAAATSAQVSGTVKRVDAKARTFTVITSRGTTTVTVTAATSYHDSLVAHASFSDLRPGDSVVAIGTRTGRAERATIVIIGGRSGGPGRGPAGGPGGFFGGTFGTVTAVDRHADRFSLKTASGATLTVTVSSRTTYRDPGRATASFADVKTGIRVAVAGTAQHGTEAATSVVIARFGGGFPGGFGGGTTGTLRAIDARSGTLTITTPAGTTVTVKVTASTTYRDGRATTSFAKLKTGERVFVSGTSVHGVLSATRVIIGFPGGFGGRPAPAGG